eukprot:12004540-Alexandrium_andersonii.AAC.1
MVWAPPGWHMLLQSGGQTGQDLIAAEWHGSPIDVDLAPMSAYLEFFEAAAAAGQTISSGLQTEVALAGKCLSALAKAQQAQRLAMKEEEAPTPAKRRRSDGD